MYCLPACVSILAKVNQSIVVLRLGNNGIGDASVQTLVAGIKINPRIQELDLSMNAVGFLGAIALADLLYCKVVSAPYLF